MSTVWIVVIVFIIIAIIFALVLWLFWPEITGTTRPEDGAPTQEVGFLQVCGGRRRCQQQLTCRGGICLKNNGQSCDLSTDCISNQCIGATSEMRGTCSSMPVGGLNQPSPCNSGLSPDVSGICRGEDGFVGCAQSGNDIHSNCLNNFCLNNICQPRRSLGQSCQTAGTSPGNANRFINETGLSFSRSNRRRSNVTFLADQCQSDLVCSLGFCQMPGITTGQEGAFCLPGGQPNCQVPLTCSSDTNTCVSGRAALGEECNTTDSPCQTGLICTGLTNTSNGVCSYPTPPSNCALTNSCSLGYTCMADGTRNKCLGEVGAICAVDSDCLSENCSSNQLAIFRWLESSEDSNQTTDSRSMGWQHVVNLPTDVIFSRFVTTSFDGLTPIRQSRLPNIETTLNDIIWGLELPKGDYIFPKFQEDKNLRGQNLYNVTHSEKDQEGGLYLLTNLEMGTWVKILPAMITNITVNSQNQRRIHLERIITLATDNRNVFVLIRRDQFQIRGKFRSKLSYRKPDLSFIKSSWIIKRVHLNMDNSAELINIPDLNPPRSKSGKIVNILDFDINTEGDIVLIGNISRKRDDCRVSYQKVKSQKYDHHQSKKKGKSKKFSSGRTRKRRTKKYHHDRSYYSSSDSEGEGDIFSLEDGELSSDEEKDRGRQYSLKQSESFSNHNDNHKGNRIWTRSVGFTFFEEIPLPTTRRISRVLFYSLQPDINSQALNVQIQNFKNIGYVTNDDPGNQRLLFTGAIEGASYPTNTSSQLSGGDRQIVDFSIGPFQMSDDLTLIDPPGSTTVNISNIWLSVIGVDHPQTDTSYLQIISGDQFQIPGYVGPNSLLFTSPTTTYTQSAGICQSNMTN